MGMDAFNGLPCWVIIGRAGFCHILVLGRSGQDVDELVAAELDLERGRWQSLMNYLSRELVR